jgi:PKD repeat protein
MLIVSMLLLECGKDDGPSGPSPDVPIASFTESGGTVTPATITFQNTSQNADSYLWRFGDGDSTTITNPAHNYNVHGVYVVTLIAENRSTGNLDIETKEITITPGTVFIESIRIDAIPFTDPYGAGWDLASGPDLYPDLIDQSNTVLSGRNYYYLDAAPSNLPIQWTLSPAFRIYNWSMAYFVEAWDYDDFGDDYIGATNGFRINDLIAPVGNVSTVTRQNNSGTIRAVITLRWQ